MSGYENNINNIDKGPGGRYYRDYQQDDRGEYDQQTYETPYTDPSLTLAPIRPPNSELANNRDVYRESQFEDGSVNDRLSSHPVSSDYPYDSRSIGYDAKDSLDNYKTNHETTMLPPNRSLDGRNFSPQHLAADASLAPVHSARPTSSSQPTNIRLPPFSSLLHQSEASQYSPSYSFERRDIIPLSDLTPSDQYIGGDQGYQPSAPIQTHNFGDRDDRGMDLMQYSSAMASTSSGPRKSAPISRSRQPRLPSSGRRSRNHTRKRGKSGSNSNSRDTQQLQTLSQSHPRSFQPGENLVVGESSNPPDSELQAYLHHPRLCERPQCRDSAIANTIATHFNSKYGWCDDCDPYCQEWVIELCCKEKTIKSKKNKYRTNGQCNSPKHSTFEYCQNHQHSYNSTKRHTGKVIDLTKEFSRLREWFPGRGEGPEPIE